MNLSTWIERWAAIQPDKCAVHFEGHDISYAAMARRIKRLANALSTGLQVAHGDRVAYLGPNTPDMLDLLFACARIGAILVPLNWRLAPPELAAIFANARLTVLFAAPEFVAGIDPVVDRTGGLQRVVYGPAANAWASYPALPVTLGNSHGPLDADAGPRGRDDGARGTDDGGPGTYDDVILIAYTSGTTGAPKGACLTQRALLYNAINSVHAHDLTSHDHVLTFLPMFHVGGLNIMTTPALHAGATVTLQRRFVAADALRAISERRPTLTIVVPATMLALQRDPGWAATDLSSLRMVNSGSSTIPLALIKPFHARGIPVGQIYGSTETCPIAVYLRGQDAERKIGSTGTAAVHCEVRVVDADGHDVPPGTSGELLVRGPNVMAGYWEDPVATAEALRDGWFWSGDIGHQDPDGYFYIDDRKTELIISGGEHVYPAELEAILAESKSISEAAVVGRPDERWGEVPVAIIVPATGAQLDAASVLALFEGRLARFKHPRAVAFVDALPRNAMGKVVKSELRERVRTA